jgi:hypothetical protein
MKRNLIKDILKNQHRSVRQLSLETGMIYHHLHTIVNAEAIPPGTTYATLEKIRVALGLSSIGELEEKIDKNLAVQKLHNPEGEQ